MNPPVPPGKELHSCKRQEYTSFSPCAAHVGIYHKDQVLLSLFKLSHSGDLSVEKSG